MAMYNPAHPGEILREEVLKPLELPITETAQHLGVSRKTLSKVLNGRGAITAVMAARLERAFGQSADMRLRMQAAYDLWQARERSADIHVSPRSTWCPVQNSRRRFQLPSGSQSKA